MLTNQEKSIEIFPLQFPLTGTIKCPGDKSISHRTLFFASLAKTSSSIHGINKGEDVRVTANCLKQLGTTITWENITTVHITPTPFRAPNTPLFLGNSGTTARLLMGLLAPHSFTTTLIGDESLSRRPMQRIIDPLEAIGVKFGTTSTLPLSMTGSSKLKAINYTLPTPSAQVKTGLMLAALQIKGHHQIIEPIPTRDHTERLMSALGIRPLRKPQILSSELGKNSRATGVYMDVHEDCERIFDNDMEQKRQFTKRSIDLKKGPCAFSGFEMTVPQDPSAALYFAVAACLQPKGQVYFNDLCWNPFRNLGFKILEQMGARLEIHASRESMGEPIADLTVSGELSNPVHVSAEEIPSLIDEIPILATAAAFIKGTSTFRGLGELRYKESDRISATYDLLTKAGVLTEIIEDELIVHGNARPRGGCTIDPKLDHRIAMCAAILALGSIHPITILTPSVAKSSFPDFFDLLNILR